MSLYTTSSPDVKRRLKILMLTESNIMGVLDGSIRLEGMPPGTRYSHVFVDNYRNAIGVIMHHDSFPVVPEGEEIPAFTDFRIKVLYHNPTQDD